MLWPDHCVQDTEGAQIAKDIEIPQANLIIRKGFRKDVDGYSAFMEADRYSGLASYFKEGGIAHFGLSRSGAWILEECRDSVIGW